MNRRYVGMDGESAARDYLTGIGARILDTNVKLSGGEIDIIALIDGVCVFIEVKRRMSLRRGRPAEAVVRSKMRAIARAAAIYAAMHGFSDMPLRFDIIELLPGELTHIPAAFNLSDIR